MDTEHPDTRTCLKLVPPRVADVGVTPQDLRDQLDREEWKLIATATADAEADLDLIGCKRGDVPPAAMQRLVRTRALWRALVLDGNGAAIAVGDDYRRLIDEIDLYRGMQPQPPQRGRKKARSDA